MQQQVVGYSRQLLCQCRAGDPRCCTRGTDGRASGCNLWTRYSHRRSASRDRLRGLSSKSGKGGLQNPGRTLREIWDELRKLRRVVQRVDSGSGRYARRGDLGGNRKDGAGKVAGAAVTGRLMVRRGGTGGMYVSRVWRRVLCGNVRGGGHGRAVRAKHCRRGKTCQRQPRDQKTQHQFDGPPHDLALESW